jgi:hypothetical protein
MSASAKQSGFPVSDGHFRAIGAIVVIWSRIEGMMEFAILGLYDFNLERGLVLTANIGFQSRLTLLRILALRGAITDKVLARTMVKMLERIEKAYPERNNAAHSVWSGTSDPNVADRMSIRVKGNRLKCAHDPVTVDQLRAVTDRLDDLRIDFSRMLRCLGLVDAQIGS